MQKMLAGVGVLSILMLLVGASHRSGGSGSSVGTATTVADLPLTSHFHLYLGTVGNFNGNPGYAPFSTTMPSDAGIAITQLDSNGGNDGWTTSIRIDGVEVWNGRVATGGPNVAASTARFNPPLIVKPGEQLSIGSNSTNFGDDIRLSISGYALTAAQLGQ